jgi:hypothetical protein
MKTYDNTARGDNKSPFPQAFSAASGGVFQPNEIFASKFERVWVRISKKHQTLFLRSAS